MEKKFDAASVRHVALQNVEESIRTPRKVYFSEKLAVGTGVLALVFLIISTLAFNVEKIKKFAMQRWGFEEKIEQDYCDAACIALWGALRLDAGVAQ